MQNNTVPEYINANGNNNSPYFKKKIQLEFWD